MADAVAAATDRKPFVAPLVMGVLANAPTLAEFLVAIASALLLVLAFPDFDLSVLAWVGLVPVLIVVGRTPRAGRASLLGLCWGIVFFYGTCWWLTYAMIRYGHLPSYLAYPSLLLPVVFVALFPALFFALVARLVSHFGTAALLASPFLWISVDWARYGVTGQLWGALGYSQAFHPMLIQSARWGGVYAVSFLLLAANVAITFALVRRSLRACALSLGILLLIAIAAVGSFFGAAPEAGLAGKAQHLIVAVQPNVPMDRAGDIVTEEQLLNRHLDLSLQELREGRNSNTSALVIWPESPMNFGYSRDSSLREVVAGFARVNHTSVMLNSLEPAPNGGEYNSAVMVNEEGQKVAEYDKIRLMPFGEYVPLPRWLPGASSVRALVGNFTTGSSYTLMPLGDLRAGVFICIEAAHPDIARAFTNEGADLLINISNDGYLGPTAVMRQHLANAVFRAVENEQSLVRVTNSGISAYIDSRGRVLDTTPAFQATVREWTFTTPPHHQATFYTRRGNLFVYLCVLVSLAFLATSVMTKRRNLIKAVNIRG